MASDWREVSLGELFKVKHGFAFKSEYFTDEPQDTVLVTPGNFAVGGGFQDGKRKYYNGQIPEGYVLRPGQVVVTMTDLSKESDTLGYAASIPDDSTIWLHNQRVGLLEFKSEIATSPRFIEYLLRTHEYRSWIVGSATGTTVKHTAPGRIESFVTRVPPIEEQVAIAHILGTLDDKIELNRKQNETLEAMARAFFKAWFVDFEPVRAKREGRWQRGQSVYGLPAYLYDLFPDRLVESELGEIPVGWGISTLSTVCSYLNRGISPRYIDLGGVLVLNQKCIRDFAIDFSKARRHDVAQKKIDGRALELGDVVVNSTGVGTLGRVAQVRCLVETTIVDSHVTVVRSGSSINPMYLGGFMSMKQPEIETMGEGSTGQTELSRTKLGGLKILLPASEVLDHFSKHTKTLSERIAANQKDSEVLTQLRNTLLPKLITGELRVPDAERLIGAKR
ncbi:restriction endonuclease subunit S [Metapseudomonas otitidis]|uniref:restriction endonuclease subunit S n=1 Tax=Metapseudomonas otitidis TaxID=319939 RepID=UPI0013F66346|nr:restriction endonuclease subunit S [Pseudomonas otitidis]